MNEMDLMKAMTDMDDNLLEMTPRRKIKGTAFIVLAALIALLVTSVSAAVYYGVPLNIERKIVNMKDSDLLESYYGTDQEGLLFYHVYTEFDLKPQVITDALYQQLSEELTRHWKLEMEFAEQYNVPIVRDENRDCNTRIRFQDFSRYRNKGSCNCRMCYLETALGFPLALTPQMKLGQLRSKGIPGINKGDESVSFYVDYGNAKENTAVIENNEMLQPEGFTLWFLMGGYPQEEDYASCYILVSLTEENAQLQKIYEMAHYEKEGELKAEELHYGETVVRLIYATPEPGLTGRAHAYYCVDGIGYCVSAWDVNGDGDAKQMLLDLLDGLAEVIEG